MLIHLTVATVLLVVLYAALWHDEPARPTAVEPRRPQPGRPQEERENQNVNP